MVQQADHSGQGLQANEPSSIREILANLRKLEDQLVLVHEREVQDLTVKLQDATREMQILRGLLPHNDSSKATRCPRMVFTDPLPDKACDECDVTAQEICDQFGKVGKREAATNLDVDGALTIDPEQVTLTNADENDLDKDAERGPEENMQGEAVELEIVIVSANHLRNADFGLGQGSSDPYCVFQVVGKPSTRVETRIDPDTMFPVWNHELVVSEFMEDDQLEFVIYDKDVGKSDDLLGRAVLQSRDFLAEGFDSHVTLMDAGSSAASLKLKISAIREGEDNKEFIEKLEKSKRKWPPLSQEDNEKRILSLYTPRGQPSLLMHLGYGEVAKTPHLNFLQKFVLLPDSRRRLCWDLIGLMCVAYDIYMIPLVEVFQVPLSTGLLLNSSLMAIYWTLDIPFNFFTGFLQSGVCEVRIKRIFRKYVQSWFAFDLAVVAIDWLFIISVFAFLYLGQTVRSNETMGLLKCMRAVRMIRYVRIMRIVSFIRVIKAHIILSAVFSTVRNPAASALMRIMEAIIFIFTVNHIVSCTWYALAELGVEDGTKTWVRAEGLQDAQIAYKYATSLHWAITQFTPASMSVQPVNLRERIFTILIDFSGMIIFSTFVSTITANMTQVRALTRENKERDLSLKEYFREHKISLELTAQVMRSLYPRVHHSRRTHLQSVRALQCISTDLMCDLKVEVYGPILRRHPFFTTLEFISQDVFQRICDEAIQEVSFDEEHEIFNHGTKAKGMYFFVSGSCHYVRAHGSFMVQDDWLSEAAVWIDGWTHRGSLVADTQTEVLLVETCVLSGILQDLMNSNAAAKHRHVCGVTSSEMNVDTLRHYIGGYAAAFLRDACDTTPKAARQSDMWCTKAQSEQLVQQVCFE